MARRPLASGAASARRYVIPDTFDPEPSPADDLPLGFANVLPTPHTAARTHTAIENMSRVVRDVAAVLNAPSHRVTLAFRRRVAYE